MKPVGESLLMKSYHLRLTLQESQDIVDGLEALISELEDENDGSVDEVKRTLIDVFNQLASQGVESRN